MHTAINEFIRDLKLVGRQPLTIEAHQEELHRLARWCNEQAVKWDELDKKTLQLYARTKADRAAATRANNMTTWRVFFSWAVEQEYIHMSPAASFKSPRRPAPIPQALSRDQVRKLISFLQNEEGLRARRDEALVYTGLYAGLRAAEMAALCWQAIDLSGAVINIRLSKMNHGRSIPLHPELKNILCTWWSLQQFDSSALPVFSLDGSLLSPARPGKICHRISKLSGVSFHTHSLRHTFATWMLRSSKDLYAVSKAIGHTDITQTEVYLSADTESTREALETLPSLTSW